MFISFLKSHNPVSKETISRWIKRTMFEAGIDTNIRFIESSLPQLLLQKEIMYLLIKYLHLLVGLAVTLLINSMIK